MGFFIIFLVQLEILIAINRIKIQV